ncbi:hypothetical protein C4D60_Mb07t11910 [Musa balbisiana]|uniref:Uncharacterized protein n=1 Tax=Musa balbisiana TaxID=52838 RepID=A0A4V4H6L1_MUSBA|nr:hypothetical protein C4D60_Mb07t11910 [Musa balbisiana]
MQSKGERRLGSKRRSSHGGWQRWWVGWATTVPRERGVLEEARLRSTRGCGNRGSSVSATVARRRCGNRRLRLRPKGGGGTMAD